MTAWYTLRLLPSEAAKQALGLLEMEPNVELGKRDWRDCQHTSKVHMNKQCYCLTALEPLHGCKRSYGGR